jgi:hypothetical protein
MLLRSSLAKTPKLLAAMWLQHFLKALKRGFISIITSFWQPFPDLEHTSNQPGYIRKMR